TASVSTSCCSVRRHESTSASVGLASSVRSDCSVNFWPSATGRCTSKRTRIRMRLYRPLEATRVKVVRHERGDVRPHLEGERHVVAARVQTEAPASLEELSREAVDHVLALSRPANDGGDDGFAPAAHERRRRPVTGRGLREDASKVTVV